jgi:DNA mismatch repair ATPase MutS
MLKKMKAMKNVINQFGEIPKIKYKPGDMEAIKSYHGYRVKNSLDPFVVDDITWNDLNMDDVFKRINMGLSTSGEQYLYHQLRQPTVSEDDFNSRKGLIDAIEQDTDLRIKLHKILYKLGKNNKAKLAEVFEPGSRSASKLVLYMILSLGFVFSAVATIISLNNILALAFFAIVNSVVREVMRKKIYTDIETVNYSVSMVFAANKIRKLSSHKLDHHTNEMYKELSQLGVILRVGGVSVTSGSDVGDLFSNWLLLDLITYEIIKNKIGTHYHSIFKIHESLGKIEAALAVSSYRKSVPEHSIPRIVFESNKTPYLQGEALIHPLVKTCVSNNLMMNKSHLVTGSNASGKSTFLKTAAINAIMGQAICTVLAKTYDATAFRIYSSMALSDNLLSGESYYISEIKSLKRIVEATRSGHAIMCVIDEVLRGTNTVERIAASSEILKAIADENTLCLVATHDVELCRLLEEQYEMVHFQEDFSGDTMIFDYKMKTGEAKSRNAIKLLRILGFDEQISNAANERAMNYLSQGVWK